MTEPGHDQSVEDRLRSAPWDLPVSESLVMDVRANVTKRRRRRRAGMSATGGAALIIAIAAAVVLPQVLPIGQDSQQPASGSLSASKAATSPASRIAGSSAVVPLGPWSFDVPPGYSLDPVVSTSTARFGPDGLQNDGGVLKPHDMAVHQEMRLMSINNENKVWITLITPQPTRDHPGPRPAASPTDAAAAAQTIVEISSAPGVSATANRTVSGISLGPARLVTFAGNNAIVLILPTGSAQVLLLQSGNAPLQTLLDVAASGHR